MAGLSALQAALEKSRALKAQQEAQANAPKPNGAAPVEKPPLDQPAQKSETMPPQTIRAALSRFQRAPKVETGGPSGAIGVTAKAVIEQPTNSPPPVTKVSAVAVIVTPRDQPEIPKTDLMKASVDDLRRNLAFLAEHMEHKELVGQVVRTVAIMLQQNPQFSTQMPMMPGDFNLIVAALRNSYKFVARKKAEKDETRETKKRAKVEGIDELEEMIKKMGLNF